MLSAISGDDKDHEFQILVNREIKLNFQQNSPWNAHHGCQAVDANIGGREL